MSENNVNLYVPPGAPSANKILAIDFDGVIHDDDKGWHDGTCYGNPILGSLEAIKALAKKYKIIIFTCKARKDRPLVNNKTGKELIQEWLKQYDIDQYIEDIVSEKPRAKFYIDDKGIRFVSWAKILKEENE